MGSKNKSSNNTKQYKIKRSKKANKADTIKVRKHPRLKKVILILFIIAFLLVLIGGGILAGIFFSDKWSITKEELISSGNTEVYDSETSINKNTNIININITLFNTGCFLTFILSALFAFLLLFILYCLVSLECFFLLPIKVSSLG